MKIIVRGKNIELTEGIESKINKKLNMLDKYFIMSDNVEAKVLIRTYPLGQKIEVTIPTEYVLLRAEVVDQDLYNAIDLVIDKLEGQIRKYKTRLSIPLIPKPFRRYRPRDLYRGCNPALRRPPSRFPLLHR